MKQSTALAILKTGKNVFLTGSAGSGKTYTLKQYIDYLRARKVPVAITASTGIASTHMSGITIHSWSGIGIKSELTEQDLIKLSNRTSLKERIIETAVLIIDEVSMLHAKQLNAINQVLKHIRKSDAPFGGVQLVLAGDFFQLPPIGERGESNRDKFAFMSESWLEADLKICYLSEQHRQNLNTEDHELSLHDILNQIRLATVTQEAITTLQNTRNNEVNNSRTRLYTHNMNVDQINQAELNKLTLTANTYQGDSDGDKKVLEMLKKTVRTSDELTLKIGARVMFIKNINELNVFNGSMGEIIGFRKALSHKEDSDTNTADLIIKYPVVRLNTGREVVATPDEWSIEDEQGMILASYSQVPLCLAWAITVHKSQGMTLEAAEIDLSRTFEKGQGYVALSRLRDLSGLKLLGLNETSLSLDPLARGADKRFFELSSEAEKNQEAYDLDDLNKVHNTFISKSGGTLNSKIINEYNKLNKRKVIKNQEKNNQSTIEITKELLQKKLSIAEIANERELAQSTIVGHIAKLKEQNIDFEHIHPPKDLIKKVNKVYQAILLENNTIDFNDDGTVKFRPIHEALSGKVTWNNIRLALIFIEDIQNDGK